MRVTTAVDSGSRDPRGGTVARLRSPRSPAVPLVNRRPSRRHRRFHAPWRALPAWSVSALLHGLLLFVLALVGIVPPPAARTLLLRVAPVSEDWAPVEEFAFDQPAELSESVDLSVSAAQALPTTFEIPTASSSPPSVSTDIDAPPVPLDMQLFSEQIAPQGDIMTAVGPLAREALKGRGSNQRAALVVKAGGSAESERAVALALEWLAAHQLSDGSWSFDHRGGACAGRCPDHGTVVDSNVAATAMGLLPFLGAGQTQLEGKYTAHVRAGLNYLMRSMESNGSLAQGSGNMYAHGMASIALCEAYAMTRDRELMDSAQRTLNYIVFAQEPVGGGWRYAPRQPGDTSVLGWQLMALKSGHMAYLQVPPSTVQGASRFLDSVQWEDGAYYRYLGSQPPRDTMTAVGLLCRMYLGWTKDHPGLQRGVALLSKTGPSPGDLYFNYYATQVLRHWGGEEWTRWNAVLRDQLVRSQSRSGHMAGSWIVDPELDRGVRKGGRLYCTSLCTMILEVYYRHMPLYQQEAAGNEFPLR
ncbi:MAG: prenyltransferase/squalene oxidase repeat-containing protein [Pirellulaceae bacterium]